MTSVQVPVLAQAAPAPEPVEASLQPAWAKPLGFITDTIRAISGRRAALGLPNPGTAENINKEVSKDVFLNHYAFSGLRADIQKSFSLNPAFQVSHSLSIGSPVLPQYVFAALYATDNLFLQGNVESDKSVSGRAHYGWTPLSTTRADLRIAPQQPPILQLEHDYLGRDYSLNFKAMNPSFLQGGFTGVIVGSLLQSLTPALSLGIEAVYSSQSPLYPPDAAVSYMGRYATPKWVASAQLQATGSVVASFWRKVADKVEAGVETTVGMGGQQAMLMGGEPTLEGTTTVGAKYEFRQSIFRGQIDSNGRVSCLVQRQVLPVVSLTFSGEIDHWKNQAKIGIGMQLEASGTEVFEQQQQLASEIDAANGSLPAL